MVPRASRTLLHTVLLVMTMGAQSRPIERNGRSSDDVLMGVDFLSIILDPNADGTKNGLQSSASTTDPAQQIESTQPYETTTTQTRQLLDIPSPSGPLIDNTLIKKVTQNSRMLPRKAVDNDFEESSSTPRPTSKVALATSTESRTDTPSTRKDGTVKRQVVSFISTTEKPPSIVPITLLSLEMNTEVYIGKNRPAKKITPTVLVSSPSEINLESKKNDFGVELSEPITLENSGSSGASADAPVQIKPEEIIARGGNPDYVAQQLARIQKSRQQDPFSQKRNPSRARAVSYSSVVQVLPHASVLGARSRQPDHIPHSSHGDGARISTSSLYNLHYDGADSSIPNGTPKEYQPRGRLPGPYNGNAPDYDYAQAQAEPAASANMTRSPPGPPAADAIAESKDYFVARKYSPDEFGDGRGKPVFHAGTLWAGSQHLYNKTKGSYEPRERPWGVPEQNYEEEEDGEDEHKPTIYNKAEVNYEIDEASSVLSNGRIHGAQKNEDGDEAVQLKVGQKPAHPDDNQKIGYVVEGRNYKKYRVEERTADGFIVGEYGVVSNNDGSLRGVRYTADGTINPRVIYDALMKFLSL